MDNGLLIGEVGASSSRWAFMQDGEVTTFPVKGTTLAGFNPLNGDAQLFQDSLREQFGTHGPAALLTNRVMVYGSGCGAPQRAETMRSALAPLWPADCHITVKCDLLAAARGLCGPSEGLVLILGTGMNAGRYNGNTLYRPMPSLGWILGDEGSGADIGRTLLQDAFYKRMPEPILSALFGAEGPSLDRVLEEVYRSPFPSRALASRTAMLVPLLDQPYVRELIVARFHALVEVLATFFSLEQDSEVYATGSVAWGFRELLGDVLLDHGMTLISVERDPLPGLVRFHRQG